MKVSTVDLWFEPMGIMVMWSYVAISCNFDDPQRKSLVIGLQIRSKSWESGSSSMACSSSGSMKKITVQTQGLSQKVADTPMHGRVDKERYG